MRKTLPIDDCGECSYWDRLKSEKEKKFNDYCTLIRRILPDDLEFPDWCPLENEKQ